MTDSSDMKITYKAIQDRAKDVAKECAPDFPVAGTVDAWESFQRDVEDMDSIEIAHESCEWDWVIYYHRALELCQAVPSDILDDAESQWHDMGAYTDEQFGLYEFAVQLAAIIVTREIMEAVESLKEELIDMAESQLDNL